MPTSVVILAAGQGKRMYSNLPKVLHRLAGQTLLTHVVNRVKLLSLPDIYVVYGSGRPQVRDESAHLDVHWIEQKQQLGTAHAVAQTLSHIPDNHRVMVLYADVPLISTDTLKELLATDENSVTWLTAVTNQPYGLGRIIRTAQGDPVAIIEESDLKEDQKQLNEINSGICLMPAKKLKTWMKIVSNTNTQGEYYLTDFFAFAVKENIELNVITTADATEVFGVNNKIQLAQLERIYQYQQAQQLMLKGVTLIDPQRFDLRGNIVCGQDVAVDINVIVEGKVKIGNNVTIGSNVYLRDVEIGDNVTILNHCVIEEATIASHCQLGPFAHIRPGTTIAEHAKIGNFVEIKKSTIGKGSKVNHLSYIGDTIMGQQVNIGAGTITCNYDGINKHQTVIEDHVFIGSNNSLVAPLKIGTQAVTGAGSTITKGVPANQLTVSRAKQLTVSNWKRFKK